MFVEKEPLVDTMVISETFKLVSLLNQCFQAANGALSIPRFVVWNHCRIDCNVLHVDGSYINGVGMTDFGGNFQ